MNASTCVLLLAGGPDRERDVSFRSGRSVADALGRAGYQVIQADPDPVRDDWLAPAIEGRAGVIFPVLHGAWGEGGPLQQRLEEAGLSYVGAQPHAARLCMDKHAAKTRLREAGLPTPEAQCIHPGQSPTIEPPVVVKPVAEGSSLGMSICHDRQHRDRACAQILADYGQALVERFIHGREVTVGLVAENQRRRLQPLPPLQIIPAADFYDYDAKYDRDDTQYRFEIDLPASVLDELASLAAQAGRACSLRDLGRVDFLVDQHDQPWILEINTLPGFTDHSLLPKAAQHAGLPMPELCHRLVQFAMLDPDH